MRIDGIEIQNFLSFDDFRWEGVGAGLNVIVGPNGAGKTNLFHALRAVVDALDDGLAREPALPLHHARHRGRAETPIRISLGLCFDTPTERDLLRAFLVAALCDDSGNSVITPESLRLSTLLLEKAPEADVSWLFSGRLLVEHDPSTGTSCRYEAGQLTWTLGVAENWLGVPGVQYSSGRPEEMISSGYEREEDRAALADYLAERRSDAPLPDLRRLLASQRFYPRVELARSRWRPTHREFARLAGDPPERERMHSGRSLFHLLLLRALVFTDNLRRGPRRKYPLDLLNAPVVELSNGENLALDLFQRKNGSADDVQRYRLVQAMFGRLTGGRSFDVGYSMGALGGDKEVQLEVRVRGEWGGWSPLEYSGMGRAEALFLSSVVAGTEGRVVLLDEPAQNLHPTVQSRLAAEIRGHTSSQFLITTHSPTLVAPEAIDKVSRFAPKGGATVRAWLDLEDLDRVEKGALQKELRGSSDARALLFARGVILVEGDAELGALPLWYWKWTRGKRLEDDDIAIYSVGSDSTFGTYLRFLAGYGVPWVVVCDGAAIGDPSIPERQRCAIAEQLGHAGVDRASDLEARPFEVRRRYLERHGVFTVARSARKGKESFEQSVPAIRDRIDSLPGQSRARKARWIAEDHDCPPEVAGLFHKVHRCLDIRMEKL